MKQFKLALMSVVAVVALSPAIMAKEGGEKHGDKGGHKGGSPEEWFKKADANADGKLTFEELKAVKADATEEKFKKMDANADGSVSLEEFTAAKAKHAGEHKEKAAEAK